MTQIEIHSQSFNFATGETTTTKRAREMTTQDKETIMHETIARASLVAFAEFIGQPISDLDATFRQARGLYGREGKKLAVVVKIPVDKTKPIEASVVDSLGVHDGVTSGDGVVTLSYWPLADSSSAKSLRVSTGGMLQFTKDTTERLAAIRAQQAPTPNPEPIPCEAECRAHVKTLNAQLGINLNEDAVLAAGEAVRVNAPAPPCSYILTIVKSTRAASFSVVPGRNVDLSGFGKGTLVIVREMFSNCSGLECALASMVRRGIPEAIAQLTPSAPTKPALTEGDLCPLNNKLEAALSNRKGPPIFVFGGNESTTVANDCRNFLALLTSDAKSLSLTFQNRAARKEFPTLPRVHVHTELMFFPSEFNTTISAPIDPANPAATLTALADCIRNENL